MNLGSLLFSPNGRIGRQDFWIGFLILFVFSILIHAVVIVGTLIWLLSLYCWICLYAKRLHDLGHSGFLQAWIYVVDVIAVAVLFGLGAGAFIAGAVSGDHQARLGLIAGSFGLMALAGFAWFLIRLAFLLWVGLSLGQAGDNRYGVQPLR